MNVPPARVVAVALFVLTAAACNPSNGSNPVVDASSSDSNCGPCPLWTVRCGEKCVDPTVSPGNCGVCGVQCDTTSEVCQGGVCVAAGRCTSLDAGALATSDAHVAPPHDAGDADTHATDAATRDAGAAVPAGAGLRGEYYGSATLSDLRFVRVDGTIDFDWTTTPPATGYPADNFTVRWTGTLRAPASDTYTFHVRADDAARIWIDDTSVFDSWSGTTATDAQFDQALVAGRTYAFRFEYGQHSGPKSVHLSWSSSTQSETIVPATAFAPNAGDAWTCASGECCVVGTTALCCPHGTTCVHDPHFEGCCPAGEDCTAATSCGGGA